MVHHRPAAVTFYKILGMNRKTQIIEFWTKIPEDTVNSSF
jgi:hypothetical protein